MSCTNCCSGIEDEFNEKSVRHELKVFRRSGAKKNTSRLLEMISNFNIIDLTLLDIGGGIGIIPLKLLQNGAAKATSIEAATAYLSTARQLAEEHQLQDKIHQYSGDFQQLEQDIEQADIVTLDKSICCYPDYRSLVNSSVQKAKSIYGIVIPRDTWWVKLVHGVGLVMRKLVKSNFRSYVHPVKEIEKIVKGHGFIRHQVAYQLQWMIAVYKKD